MKFKSVKRCTTALCLSVLFVLPQTPHAASAAQRPGSMAEVGLPTDLFPIDNVVNNDIIVDDDSDILPDIGTTPGQGQGSRPGQGQNGRPNVRPGRPNQSPGVNGNRITMSPAMVTAEYRCDLFDNRPNSELITAIDTLNKQVVSTPGCKDDASAKEVGASTDQIKTSIAALKQIMAMKDPGQVDVAKIESSVATALQATQSIGSVLNNSSFLNSQCGRQTMSSGQALLSFNNILNGLGPYALMAVSMSAALAPALPFVIGGIAVTSGISLAAKMYQSNTLDMTKPEIRKALLQNTCQYIKVAKKVRFMELAQSGQIQQISQQLQFNINQYKHRFADPSPTLSPLLQQKDAWDQKLNENEAQLRTDRVALNAVEEQLIANPDDLLACSFTQELAKQAADAAVFPSTIISNLESITKKVTGASAIQASTMRGMHNLSVRRIQEYQSSLVDDANLHSCAQTGRSWIAGLHQALNSSGELIEKQKKTIDTYLSKSSEYRDRKSLENQIRIEQMTADRVEKALEILASDDSLIDRSELSQRISSLKAGLFGSKSALKLSTPMGAPPVLAWLRHTKSAFDQEIGKFTNAVAKLQEGDMSFSSTGKNAKSDLFWLGLLNEVYPTQHLQAEVWINLIVSKSFGNLNLKNLPLGTRQNEIACQQLEISWLSWSAALDHLGANQLFCNMIDGNLDVTINSSIIDHCRGRVDLNGHVDKPSVINEAKSKLIDKGYQRSAMLVNAKMAELKCPMPTISVMTR